MGLREAILGALILEYMDDECEEDCDCEDGHSYVDGECVEDDDDETPQIIHSDEDDGEYGYDATWNSVNDNDNEDCDATWNNAADDEDDTWKNPIGWY